MPPSATPATQSTAASPATKRAQARHRQPAAISATPATQSGGECRQVPCLPRKVPRHQSQPSAISAMPRKTLATQSEGGCRQVPRLPRKVKVDAAKCHACHTKYRGVTGDQARPSAPPSASPEPARCDKCSACHAKYTAAPAIKRAQAQARPSATRASPMPQVPHLPRKTKVDVAKCHACTAKRRWTSPNTTPATRNEGGCRQVPRLPRKVPRRHRRPSAPKRATRVTLQIDRQIDRQTDRQTDR